MELKFDCESAAPTPNNRQGINERGSGLELGRRRLLKLSVASIVAGSVPGRLINVQSALEPCAPPIPQSQAPSNGAPVHTRFHGWTKMAITTRLQRPMWNYRASITSREGWLAAAASTGWGQTTRAIASRGVPAQRTTATWPGSTGPGGKCTRRSSPIRDSPYSRDRRSHRIRFMTSIRLFLFRDSNSWFSAFHSKLVPVLPLTAVFPGKTRRRPRGRGPGREGLQSDLAPAGAVCYRGAPRRCLVRMTQAQRSGQPRDKPHDKTTLRDVHHRYRNNCTPLCTDRRSGVPRESARTRRHRRVERTSVARSRTRREPTVAWYRQ